MLARTLITGVFLLAASIVYGNGSDTVLALGNAAVVDIEVTNVEVSDLEYASLTDSALDRTFSIANFGRLHSITKLRDGGVIAFTADNVPLLITKPKSQLDYVRRVE